MKAKITQKEIEFGACACGACLSALSKAGEQLEKTLEHKYHYEDFLISLYPSLSFVNTS